MEVLVSLTVFIISCLGMSRLARHQWESNWPSGAIIVMLFPVVLTIEGGLLARIFSKGEIAAFFIFIGIMAWCIALSYVFEGERSR